MPSRSYSRVLEDAGRFELSRGNDSWPSALDALEDVERLYGVGDPAVLSRECLSVIGARRATPYGLACARMAARVAAESGIVVVSGGAMAVTVRPGPRRSRAAGSRSS